MSNSKLRILYVASEINPFLEIGPVSEYLSQLPHAMQERGMEIRILVPRFGVINERKNRLHEVVRLSGINISVGDEEKPLVIKVASIPNARLQVYFIDNDDYFHRKSVFFDNDNLFHADNDDRVIFFCKGVLETVKKLGWAPDIVHCNDWATSLIPLYLKTTYKNDPIYKNSKSVFSVYNTDWKFKFNYKELVQKVKMMDIDDSMLKTLSTADYDAFIKLGVQHADAVIKAAGDIGKDMEKLLKDSTTKSKLNTITKEDEGDFADSYFKLYNELAG